MMTLNEIRQELVGLNYSDIARSIDVSRQLIAAIAAGKVDGTVKTLEKLSRYIKNKEK